MKSSQRSSIDTKEKIGENEVKNIVTSKFCLSCNKELSNSSSIPEKTIVW